MSDSIKGLTKECLKAMDDLMSRPWAQIFLYPIPKDTDFAKDYYAIIKNPMDLTTVRKKIENDEYSTLKQWMNDMTLVWTNAEEFNKPQKIFLALAEQLKRAFHHHYKRIKAMHIRGWSKRLALLKSRFDDLLDNPPIELQSIQVPVLKDDEPEYQPFTEADFGALIKASTYMNSQSDSKRIQAILIQHYPHRNFSDDSWKVDVNNLSTLVLNELRSFFQKRMTEMGIAYPQTSEPAQK